MFFLAFFFMLTNVTKKYYYGMCCWCFVWCFWKKKGFA